MINNCTVFGMPAHYVGIAVKRYSREFQGYARVLVWNAYSERYMHRTVRLDKVKLLQTS